MNLYLNSYSLLLFSNYITNSLTWGWVCNLVVQLILGLARAVTLGSKSRRTQDHILFSFDTTIIHITQEEGGPNIYPDNGVPFRLPARILRLRWRNSNKTHHISFAFLSVRWFILRPTVRRPSMPVYCPWPHFCFSSLNLNISWSWAARPLWREDYSTIWIMPVYTGFHFACSTTRRSTVEVF
jgi:hypothetical protein